MRNLGGHFELGENLWTRFGPLGLAFALFASFAGPALAAGPNALTPDSTVSIFYVVRHAEQHPSMIGTDPPLSDEGVARAQVLARVLADAGVKQVYSTLTKRTIQTGLPLARQIGDSVRTIDDTDELLKQLKAQPPGMRALVVAHSNTLADIIQGLTGRAMPPFKSGEFDMLYVVIVVRNGPAQVLLLRYGEPS